MDNCHWYDLPNTIYECPEQNKNFWLILSCNGECPINERIKYVYDNCHDVFSLENNNFGIPFYTSNFLKSSKISRKCINKIEKYDKEIFKYYVKKIDEYRNKGYIFDEDDKNYLEFCNYFKTYV